MKALLLAPLAAVAVLVACSCGYQGASKSGDVKGPTYELEYPARTAQAARAAGTQPAAGADGTFRYAAAPASVTPEHMKAGQRSCLACHSGTFNFSMHKTAQVACTDCHGGEGDFAVRASVASLAQTSPEYVRVKERAHGAKPTHPELYPSSANPNASGGLTMLENSDWIRFVNPGDLRAAGAACGACHREQVDTVRTSMMRHGAMLWGAALYNNGSINRKTPVFGEFYTADGQPAMAVQRPLPTVRQAETGGLLSILWPLPRWEISQPSNVLRVFENGARFRPIIGIPDPQEDAGRPDVKLSLRGFGTDVRTDPVLIGLQKTRLFDPTLNTLGTNDHPGDYRASGCSACHVVYANDRSPVHSTTMWNRYGNLGQTYSLDPTVNTDLKGRAPSTQPAEGGLKDPPAGAWEATTGERGHPVRHMMERNVPTAACISCHIHPGTNVLNSYTGFLWWDNETDGRVMYPRTQQHPSNETEYLAQVHNPEGSASRGLWSDLYPDEPDHTGRVAGHDFLAKTGSPEFNQRLTRTQFADYHGHGWMFRAVFKQDRHGNMLDYAGNVVPPYESDPAVNQRMAQAVAFQSPKVADHPPAGVPVHLKDIHLERGMQCADCHFEMDTHGNGNLYGETRNAVHIQCEDCHGSNEHRANLYSYLLIKGGAVNGAEGEDRRLLRGAFSGTATRGKTDARKEADNEKAITAHFDTPTDENAPLIQRGAVDRSVTWQVPQFSDTTNPASWWVKAVNDSAAADKAAPGGAAPPPARPDAPAAPAAPAAAPPPAKSDRATLARWAHTVRTDGKTWGTLPTAGDIDSHKDLPLAHPSSTMSCYACHSSWNTSCFGCHLPQRANMRMPMLHNEGTVTRNYTNYNYQTLRDDVYMLGVDSTARDHKVVPIRSSCAVLVSSQDAERQWIYTQQQTVSAEGYAGTAFTPYFPHTVRSTETKQCTDCHLSKREDNNAIMAQLLLQGTNSVNFIGRFAWVGMGGGGLEAVAVTEREEPQAVIGSTLHQLAYPEDYKKHVDNGRELKERYGHEGEVLDLQLRGEYLYAACGSDGFIAYDVANIDDKGFSERIVTAPVSPLGQRFYVRSRYATCICSPSTLALDPSRPRLPENEEGLVTEIGHPEKVIGTKPIHPLYAFLYMGDREEGLIVVGNPLNTPHEQGGPGVVSLLDGDPDNNFLQRARPAFNPGGILNGTRHIDLYGTLAYISCDRGLVVVDLNDPLNPQVVTTLGAPEINGARRVTFQFRYGFVCDRDGVKVINVTDPRRPIPVRRDGGQVMVAIPDARDLYVSRTYGYVAAGRQGLVILDLERPESPRRLTYPGDFPRDFNADAGLTDSTAVRLGMTNASMFAYVADGVNGLKVLQLTSPEYTPTYLGFSPRPEPRLVSHFKTRDPAIALSKGLDRDRAVDEAGNQLSVFNRKGARPFTLEEMQRLYLHRDERTGGERRLYFVGDGPDPDNKPLEPPAGAAAPAAPEAPPPAEPAPPRTRSPFGPRR